MAVPELSAVEQQIVLLVAQGWSRRAIADELGLSLKTVDWHVAGGRRKLERTVSRSICRSMVRPSGPPATPVSSR